MKKEFKYDIESLCQTFKEHAEEVQANSDELTIVGGFNFPKSLHAICEEIKEIRTMVQRMPKE